MESVLFQKVLACPNLPSLPGVALRVLELTGAPDTPLKELAKVVERDQALAAKILRTVNSSFYALSKPCGTVDRALNYLGLNTVKSLVLGFSLIESTRGVAEGTDFNLANHWTRSIYSAVGARVLGLQLKRCDADEAFTASLFQDIGMLAAVTALQDDYVAVASGCDPGEDAFCDSERNAFEFDHAQLGAALAKKWRLPDSYTAVIQHHHRLGGVPSHSLHLVRTAVLSRYAANGIMGQGGSSMWESKLHKSARDWFGVDMGEVDATLDEIATAAKEVAQLFDQELESPSSAGALMAEAQERAIQVQFETERASHQDALTGLGNRRRLDERLEMMHRAAGEHGATITVIMCDGDRFKLVNDTYGHKAGDLVLSEIAERLVLAVNGRGEVFRYGGEEFAIIASGLNEADGMNMGESIREAMATYEVDISELSLDKSSLPVTLSVGVCHADPAVEPVWPSTGGQWIERADAALYQAKQNGRNRVERWQNPAGDVPVASAQPSHATRILIVEDDPLAAAIWRTLLGKVPVQTAFEAGLPGVKRLLAGGYRPDIAVVDHALSVGTGPEVIEELRRACGVDIPILLVSATMTRDKRDRAMAAGATGCMSKIDLCSQLGSFIEDLAAGVLPNRCRNAHRAA